MMSDLRSLGRGRATWALAAGGLAGLVLLVYLVVDLGPARIAAQLTGMGRVLPLVLLITGLKYPLQTAGWRLALPPERRPPWRESIGATISGDALGYLTWAGPVTGEPVRALLTRRSTPVADGVAAGAAERALYNLSGLALVLTALILLTADIHGARIAWMAGGLGVVALCGVLIARRQTSREKPRATVDTRFATSGRTGGAARKVVIAVKELWTSRRGALPAIAALCLLQHALLTAEAYVLLGVAAGHATVRTALFFEAVTKIVNTVGAVVPGRLGISEGGNALLADVLGLGASYGLSLSLMRRVRALVWTGVGLALLPFQEARARRAV